MIVDTHMLTEFDCNCYWLRGIVICNYLCRRWKIIAIVLDSDPIGLDGISLLCLCALVNVLWKHVQVCVCALWHIRGYGNGEEKTRDLESPPIIRKLKV